MIDGPPNAGPKSRIFAAKMLAKALGFLAWRILLKTPQPCGDSICRIPMSTEI
jgi:hypothetical protein